MLNQILRPISRCLTKKAIQPCRSDSTKKKVNYAVLDDAPVPEGCWTEHNAKLQKNYNRQFILGVGSLVLTIAMIYEFDMIFWNYSAPKIEED